MSGMGGAPLSTSNSLIVSTFQSSLLHGLLIVLGILAMLAIAWNLLRSAQLRRAVEKREFGASAPEFAVAFPEPLARRILRIGFGLIWLFDGILQAQWSMPVGLANQVIAPSAVGSSSWVVHLVNSGALIWNNHPITAAVSSVWVQVGIGVWLLVTPRGRWSQAAGVVSVGWGLVVWIFGEAFGAIFAPGATILFGTPGAVLFYCLAGGLVALPETVWSSRRLGRLLLGVMGMFFVGMAILQAWPGRGFWQGAHKGHATGTLVGMVNSMAATPQPGFLSGWVSAFGAFDAAHGFAVNLFVVIGFGVIGLALCSGRPRLVKIAVVASCVLCLADWVLIEDFGFFGGLGTDPNSMIPISLLVVAGYAALVRPSGTPANELIGVQKHPFIARAKLDPTYAFRSLAALGAAAIVLLGAAPMAVASTNPNADPIVTEATNGTPQVTNAQAPSFSLIDQYGRRISLASLRGKAIALTFLDPVCTSDCPLIGQEFRQADVALKGATGRTEFVAIVANPLYRSTFYTNAFDREEGLNHLSNWLYLTGSVAQLSKIWGEYGVDVQVEAAGAMVDHTNIAYVIDPRGHARYVLSPDPAAGTSTSLSSFEVLLDQELGHVILPAR